MFERFTDPAREALVQAQQYSRNLGHPFIGTEHLLLGVVAVDDPASALLRDHGLTPEKVQAALLRLTRTADEGPATRMFGGLDRDALASIGIDLDEVRTRIEASFGPGALTRAALNRPQRRHLLGRRRRARGRTGPANQTGPVRGRVPFTRRAKKSLELSLRESARLGDHYIGVEHVALAVIGMPDGVVPKLLAGLGVSPDNLRATVVNQRRKAS